MARCASGFRSISIAYEVLNKIQQFNLRNRYLRLQWIPSHVGLSGNEEADCLAKKAVSDGIYISIRPDYSEFLSKYKNKCYIDWKIHFNELSKSKGIWYKTIQCEPARIPWFHCSKLSRSYLVLAFRLRSGHMPLKKFDFLMKKTDSPNCTFCGVVEDIHHLVVECGRSVSLRQNFMQIVNITNSDVGILQTVLANPTSESALSLFKYVSQCISLR